MSPVRKNVFVYMIMFLRELLKHAESNDLTAEFLGMIFSQVFIVNASKKQQLSNAAQLIQSGLAENPESEVLRKLFQSVLATQLGTRRFIE